MLAKNTRLLTGHGSAIFIYGNSILVIQCMYVCKYNLRFTLRIEIETVTDPEHFS